VTLLIRPESLRLVTDQPSGPPGLQGVVEDATYLGGLRKYTIRLNPSEALVARLPSRTATGQLSPGSRVRVEWDPQDLRLL
jgi:ABC-type Fe3+/spermidine/putrescine transport system ATPase subunit